MLPNPTLFQYYLIYTLYPCSITKGKLKKNNTIQIIIFVIVVFSPLASSQILNLKLNIKYKLFGQWLRLLTG